MADVAMPDEVQGWMRWVLVAVSFVSYGTGGAMGVWQTQKWHKKRATARIAELESQLRGKQANPDRQRERNAARNMSTRDATSGCRRSCSLWFARPTTRAYAVAT